METTLKFCPGCTNFPIGCIVQQADGSINEGVITHYCYTTKRVERDFCTRTTNIKDLKELTKAQTRFIMALEV